jgi:hypothetical protein
MTSLTKRTKNRAGLVLLSVLSLAGLALVGSGTVAWGHGSIAGGGDRVHTCVRGGAPRTVRVVTDTQTCTGSETGIDFPHNGTFIGVDLAGPVTTSVTAAANDSIGPITVQCPGDPPPPGSPTHRAIGATMSQSTDLLLTESRLASPTSWEVRFVALTGGPKTVTVSAICMRLFNQL